METGAGLSEPNIRGTLALPRPEGTVNGTASSWFFNLADDPSLDAVGAAYTVFGRVVGNSAPRDAIAAVRTTSVFADPFEHLPVKGSYTDGDPIDFSQLVLVKDVRLVPTYPDPFSTDVPNADVPIVRFRASSTRDDLVQARIDGSDLVLSYPGAGPAVTIKVEALDRNNVVVETIEFAVTVQDAGGLDPGFANGEGVKEVPFDTIDVVTDLATEPDEKIVVVGSDLLSGGREDFAIARVDVDGTPDESFGPTCRT